MGVLERTRVSVRANEDAKLVDFPHRQFVLADNVRLVAGAREWAIYKLDDHNIIRVDPETGRRIGSGNLNPSAVRQLVAAGIYVERDLSQAPVAESKERERTSIPFRSAWLELTDACNLSCSHCYMNAGTASANAKTSWHRVIEYLSAYNCRQAIFIGGEPLCHPQFLEYVDLAKRIAPSMRLCAVTNGTLWNDALLTRMRELDVFLKFSLLGSSSGRHDGVTRVKGSFDAAVRNIDSAIRLGIRLEISSTIVPASGETSENMSEFIVERFGSVKHSTTSVRPQGRQTQCRNLTDSCSEDQLAVHVSKEFFDLSKRKHPCLYGKAAFTHSGLVHPCIMSRFESLSIDSVLTRNPEEVFHRWWTLTKDEIGGCRDCALRYACFDCRGFASSLTDPPSNCRLAAELFASRNSAVAVQGKKTTDKA